MQRAMNSAQGERQRLRQKQSELATQPGANQANNREYNLTQQEMIGALFSNAETEQLNNDGEMYSVEDILSVQHDKNSSLTILSATQKTTK